MNAPNHPTKEEDDARHAFLLTALSSDPRSQSGPETYTIEVTSPSPYEANSTDPPAQSSPPSTAAPRSTPRQSLTAVRIIPPPTAPARILAPVTLPEDEAAVRRWLASRGHDTANLIDCVVLCQAAGQRVHPRFYQRYMTFMTAARRHGVCEEDVPDEIDIIKGRAWPRLLCAVAGVARRVDEQGWLEAGGWPARSGRSGASGEQSDVAGLSGGAGGRGNEGDSVVVRTDGDEGVDGQANGDQESELTDEPENNEGAVERVGAGEPEAGNGGSDGSSGIGQSKETWMDRVLNEAWDGDDVAREMVSICGKNCCVIVTGTQGGGKSATIDTLMGRPSLPQSHALSYTTPPQNLSDEEREALRRYKHLLLQCWPNLPLELNMPTGSNAVDRVYAKLDGHMLKFVELPSLETAEDAESKLGVTLDTRHGIMRDVIAMVQRDAVDVAVVVDRLDDLDATRFRLCIQKLQKLFGSTVLQRLIVVLTHGGSLPPEGMTYEVWVYDRIRVAREVVRKLRGRREEAEVPVVIFENGGHEEDVGMSTRRTESRRQFVEEFRRILHRMGAADASLRPVPTKRWWEGHALLLAAAFLVTRIRG